MKPIWRFRMDDRTSKHLVTGLRTDAQQIAANILAGGVDKLLLSCVFHLFLSATEEWGRLMWNLFSVTLEKFEVIFQNKKKRKVWGSYISWAMLVFFQRKEHLFIYKRAIMTRWWLSAKDHRKKKNKGHKTLHPR